MRLLRALLHWVFAATTIAPKDITDLFRVNLTSNENGGCKWVGESKLQLVLFDAHTLAVSGIRLMDDYLKDDQEEAKRLVKAFFKGATNDDAKKLKKKYEIVKKWIFNGGPVMGGANKAKPFLFCGNSMFKEQTLHSVALDGKGEAMKWRHGGSMFLYDIADYRKRHEDAKKLYGVEDDQVKPWINAQYHWRPNLNERGRPAQRYCGRKPIGTGTAGVIQALFRTAPWVMMCPNGFDRDIEDSNEFSGRLHRLRTGDLRPLTKDHIENAMATDKGLLSKAQTVSSMATPSALTLFHELFHLVLGNGITSPKNGEVYSMEDLINLGVEDAELNPESYAIVAMAYDITMRTAPEGGHRVEFYMGYVSQG